MPERCIDEDVVGGDAFVVDASTIRADANREKGGPDENGLPEGASSRAIDEYIATLDDAAFGGATPIVSKYLSPADPAARWTSAHRKGQAFYAYSVNYLNDCQNAVIVDVDGSAAIRTAELAVTRQMIDRVEARHALAPERLSGDTAYGSADMLGWLVYDRGIEPHIPVFDKSARKDGTLERAAFDYDRESDTYTCPAGKPLKTTGRRVNDGTTLLCRASKKACEICPDKPRCCPRTPSGKVPRSIHEGARDMARDIWKSEAYVTSRRERKKVEMLFAHLKRIMNLDRLRLRGPNGANDEFLLAATAQNLRKLAKLSVQGAIPVSA